MTPIARELLAPSLGAFGRSSTLPAAAYTDASVFRWEQERFFDRGWVCAGRAGGDDEVGNQRVVEWQGWLFANVSGDAPTFEEHVGNLEDLVRDYGCAELVVAASQSYEVAGTTGADPALIKEVLLLPPEHRPVGVRRGGEGEAERG